MTRTGRAGGPEKGSGRLWRYVPLGIVGLGMVAFFALGLHRTLGFESLVRHHEAIQRLVEAHRPAMLGLYMLVYVAAVTLSLPVAAFLTTIGGYLFGWAIGGFAAAVAATLGGTCIFLIARTSFGGMLLRRASGRLEAMAQGFRRQAFSYLLFLRLLPVVPFWVTNLAAAAFGVRLKTFVLATQIGVIPASFAFAVAGSGLDDVIAGQEAVYRRCLASGGGDCRLEFSPESLLTPELMIALAALGILALAPILVRRWRAQPEEE